MIFSRPLTPGECRTSLRRLALYNLVNGLSFAGVGETVMVLVAVRLGCPDAVCAAFGGTLFYAGFAAMPLGRLAAGRWGAARGITRRTARSSARRSCRRCRCCSASS